MGNQTNTLSNQTACVKGYYQTSQNTCCYNGSNVSCYPPQLATVKKCRLARNAIDANKALGENANLTKIFETKIMDKLYNAICGQVK